MLTENQVYRILDALIDENNTPTATFRAGQLLSHGPKSHMRALIRKAGSDPDKSETVTITAELTRKKARLLAQFLKRLTWSAVKDCCQQGVEDPDDMMAATEVIRQTLNERGYSPR